LLTCCAPFSGSAQDRPIAYTAEDSIVSNAEEGTVELFNNVNIVFGETTLQAGYAKIYWKDQLVEAKGYKLPSGEMTQQPVFVESGKTFYLVRSGTIGPPKKLRSRHCLPRKVKTF